MDLVKERLQLGRDKYGHGVRVDMDTTTWGTPKNSWMEMANEEFLDAIVYVTADYIRKGREKIDILMSDMEVKYCAEVWDKDGQDDNGLILYILENLEHMEDCKHKTLLENLFNIVETDL